MAGKKGYEGSFKLGANTVGEMTEWSLDIEGNTEDDSSFGDAWEDPEVLQRKWSGSVKGKINLDDAYQEDLQDAVLGGTTVTARFYIDGTGYYTGTALVTKLSTSPAKDNIIPVEFTLLGKGAITPPA